MYEIRYVLRLNAQSKKTKEFPVNLEVTIGNQRPRPYSTDVFVLKKYWENGKVSSKDPLSFSKNEKLSQLQILANEILLRLKLDKKLTYEDFHAVYKQSKKVSSTEQADVVAELVKGNTQKEVTKHCLFTYFENYINSQSVLKSWSEEYTSSFKYEVNKWRNFHKFRLAKLKEEVKETGEDENSIKESFFIEDITESIIIEFIEYLKDELSNEVNTVYKSNKRSRQIFNYAQKKDKIITENPYEDVKLVQIVKIPTHLSANELNILECLKQKLKKQKTYRHLLNILNYFLFACYTGLRYQTLESLTHREVYDMQHIEVFLNKTKTPTIIPLSDRAKACLPEINPYSDEKVFQVRCNQYGNRELKIIALMAGIDKRLTHHVARHTFATISLAIGIDLPFVSKLLGHSNMKQTLRYAHITDPQRFVQMEKWNDNFETVVM